MEGCDIVFLPTISNAYIRGRDKLCSSKFFLIGFNHFQQFQNVNFSKRSRTYSLKPSIFP